MIRRRDWEDVIARSWRPILLAAFGCLAVPLLTWEIGHLSSLPDFVMRASDDGVRQAQTHARTLLTRMVWWVGPLFLICAALILVWVRQGRSVPRLSWVPLVLSLLPLPLFLVPGFEIVHPYWVGLGVLALAFFFARTIRDSRFLERVFASDISSRAAWWSVIGAWLLFVAWMGFLAHWRFITFHAETYDASWETNAVHGIVTGGVPSISCGVGDFYWRHEHLPVTYFDTHTPFIYYLYAPFYALWRDTRTLLWLQTLHMGAGAFGVFLFARRWLRHNLLSIISAVAYLMHPSIQGHCLHDVHANSLAIPTMLLALGLMEAGKTRWALVAAFLTALCREEAPLYSACVGLFWMFSPAGGRTRFRSGLAVVLGSGAILLFVTQWLMPHFGGQPRWSHFSLYFDNHPGIGAFLKSVFFNPLGTLVETSQPYKLEYAWLTLLPTGLLALRGGKGGWFLLTPLALLVPTDHRDFFAAGMNYSAPLVAPVIIMGVFGLRRVLLEGHVNPRTLVSRRVFAGTFLLVAAVSCNLLWGNILAKSYKIEYGMWPFRRSVEYNYENQIGSVTRLPRFGARERGLWDVIAHVPHDRPISTSWSINPQLSNRRLSYHYPAMGEGHQPEAMATCVVFDKLPPLMDRSPEADIEDFRKNPAWRVLYENEWGVIFVR